MSVSNEQIEWLNTPICANVNYWTILHIIYGMLWGFSRFELQTFIIVHILLEWWEIYTFGHMDSSTYDVMDILIDMVGGITGWIISRCYPQISYGVILWFVGMMVSKERHIL